MPRTLSTTPRQDGFRMPGEFEPHDGCWMLFPERSDVWRDGAKPAQRAFAAVASAISQFEPVTMGVSTRQYHHARVILPPEVRVIELTCNDSWMRDMGPTFVINDDSGDVRGVHWDFNAWGGDLYFPWDQDQMVGQKVLELANVDRYKAPLILEGGAITVDGQGTLITTKECLLHENRNPHLSQAQIETHLKNYLNLEKIIWLPLGNYDDETNGHVDGICCFIRPGVVALNWTDDPQDPQHAISQEAYDLLSNVTDAQGRKLEIHKIHQATPMTLSETEANGIDWIEGVYPRLAGERLNGSYINFYMANGGAVVPTFDDPQRDEAALNILVDLMPERRVVGVPGREIQIGGGNVHCITQQQPCCPRR